MPQKWTRRIFLKRTTGAILTAIGLGSGCYIYANQIGPYLLDIQEIEMTHPLIPSSFNGVKIVQFSDTHLGFHYSLSQFRKLTKIIKQLTPDIIFFTGDLMDEPNRFMQINELIPLLDDLTAPLGKYCIFGNHDHGGYGSELYRNVMETTNFTVLLNQSEQIKLSDGSSICLLGIDDAMLGKPDFSKAQKNIPEHQFKLLLSHAPDLADIAAQYHIHWQISGHSHGGQVKLPFAGALVTPPFGQIYPEGLYTIGSGHQLTLYVNRGIGTTRLPFRFMARPELTVFTMKSEKETE
ncbi:metallophosphoesterase [Neobacillus dielmonensis]|uniref:metallophosphoesterase n=1 Tax=Neobacillus dielmonensis TaxID=1347369 RepID=UPI0005A7C09B|nr:metallophosphoesterase [Neobacillus dielmonensis]